MQVTFFKLSVNLLRSICLASVWRDGICRRCYLTESTKTRCANRVRRAAKELAAGLPLRSVGRRPITVADSYLLRPRCPINAGPTQTHPNVHTIT
jgi:hypothetical protein